MFETITEDLNYIAKLSDKPEDDGLTATELKAEFDKGTAYLKEYINTKIVSILNSTGSENIGSVAIDGLSGNTVYSQLAALKGKLPPSGSVTLFAGSTIPSTLLLCDGSAVSRATYSALYSAIGTIFGTGDGSTTFNLPNLTANNLSGNIRYVIIV